jgi:sporulation protein YlmC with PRC-barrel domain
MFYFTSKLKTYNINAVDGEVGRIKDLYFDDQKWAIRYAVVDTRKWLPGRRVLLSPTSFTGLDNKSGYLKVAYDKEAVRNSPEIPDEDAISKDIEDSIAGYYGWNRYWTGNLLWGPQDSPLANFQHDEMTEEQSRYNQQLEEQQKYDLRSEDETMDYKVHASDGKLGKVVDMVYDDEYWKIHHIVVQSSENYVEETFFVFDISYIESVDWYERDIYIKTTVETAEQHKYESIKEIIPNL